MADLAYDDDDYGHDDWYDDIGPAPKEEPDCGGCNDSGWRRPWGYRRILARVLPLCIVWLQWNGLLRPLSTLGGKWPCGCCNSTWIDTWWLPRQLERLRWWWWRHRWGRPSGAYYGDGEPPF